MAGAVVGMAEVWYIGPLGKMAGGMFGTDLGFEVCDSLEPYPVLQVCSTVFKSACCRFRRCNLSSFEMVGDLFYWQITYSTCDYLTVWLE